MRYLMMFVSPENSGSRSSQFDGPSLTQRKRFYNDDDDNGNDDMMVELGPGIPHSA